MWGTAASSDPTNDTHAALNQNNHYTNNTNGRNGTDTNQFDYFNDGSGSGNCYSGNTSQTFDVAGTSTTIYPTDYPSCPAPAPPAAGTGSDVGDPGQVTYLINYVTNEPPCKQEDSWAKHAHPKYKNYKPLETTGPCTNRPSKAKQELEFERRPIRDAAEAGHGERFLLLAASGGRAQVRQGQMDLEPVEQPAAQRDPRQGPSGREEERFPLDQREPGVHVHAQVHQARHVPVPLHASLPEQWHADDREGEEAGVNARSR